MKKTMSAEEWYKAELPDFLQSNADDVCYTKWRSVFNLMEAYANYKAKAIIESLTDDEIEEKSLKGLLSDLGSAYEDGHVDGMTLAREELLKRIK